MSSTSCFLIGFFTSLTGCGLAGAGSGFGSTFGGAATTGFSCTGVGGNCSIVSVFGGSGGGASACWVTGPTPISSVGSAARPEQVAEVDEDGGKADAGRRRALVPGSPRRSAPRAAARWRSRLRHSGGSPIGPDDDAAQAWSWLCGRRFQADECDLQIARVAQRVHDLHQVAVADRLVGAQEDPFVLVIVGGGVERAGKALLRRRAFTDRDD